jgi:hypothetical protein
MPFVSVTLAGNTNTTVRARRASPQPSPRIEGAKREALVSNYASMLEDQVVVGEALPFEDLMANGEKVAATVNAPAKT